MAAARVARTTPLLPLLPASTLVTDQMEFIPNTCHIGGIRGLSSLGSRPSWDPFHHKFSFSPDTGIECPRGARNLPGLVQEGEPFSEEATLFTKELVLQREVGFFPVASCVGTTRKLGSPGLTFYLPTQRWVVTFPTAQPCTSMSHSCICLHLISLSPASLANHSQWLLSTGGLACVVNTRPASQDPNAESLQLCSPPPWRISLSSLPPAGFRSLTNPVRGQFSLNIYLYLWVIAFSVAGFLT